MVNFLNIISFSIIWFGIQTVKCQDVCKILAILPSVWKSHYIYGRALVNHLVQEKTCTATIISPYNSIHDKMFNGSNVQEIKVEGLLKNWLDMGMSFDIEKMYEQSILERFIRLIYASTSNVDALLSNEDVRNLQNEQKYDLLILDLFLNEALLGFAFYYNIPAIVISPSGSNTWLHQVLGNPHNAALDPSNFLPFTENMTIWQRCLNTLMLMFEQLTYSFFHMIAQQAVYEKHFTGLNQKTKLPHSSDLTDYITFAVINSHPVLQYPRAYLPNILNTVGIHLNNALNASSQKYFIDFTANDINGWVYMSLGANEYNLPQDKWEIFMDAFESLPQLGFMIKYDTMEESINLTKNASHHILRAKWWPQQDILANHRVYLFISTCGVMSVTEAIYNLKPILAMPILPEQKVLAQRLQTQGIAFVVNYEDVTYQNLLGAITCILTNITHYRENLQRLKRHLQSNIQGTDARKLTLNAFDLLMQPDGAHFLTARNHNLNFWRTTLLDVLAILVLGLAFILTAAFLLIHFILKRSYPQQQQLESFISNGRRIQHSNSYRSILHNLNINGCGNGAASNVNATTPTRRSSTLSQQSQESNFTFNADIEKQRCYSSNLGLQLRKCPCSSQCLCSTFHSSSSSSSAPATPSFKGSNF